MASYEGESPVFNAALVECQNVFDLCIALWGKLSVDDDDEAGGRRKLDSHEVTMMRREAFSKWMENVVERSVNEDLRKARASGDHVDQVYHVLPILWRNLHIFQSVVNMPELSV